MAANIKIVSLFGGWVAFKAGKVVRTKDRRIMVYSSEEAAKLGAAKSKNGTAGR